LVFTDYDFLKDIENIIIDLSTGTSQVNFTWGEMQTVFTAGYRYPKNGLRSFAILDEKHLMEIYCRLIQNEAEGSRIEEKKIYKKEKAKI
jgi:hypothetical protein